ncbi:hypothetical protein PTKIN_Ptkin03bG0034600 [Pterospermum kingtungense]
MNPTSYSTVLGDPAEGTNNFLNAVYITPIFAEDHGVLEKTLMLEDPTTFIDIFAEKHPVISTTTPPYPFYGNLDVCSTSANNLVDESNFICDLPICELSMLSPQALEHAFQDYTGPIDTIIAEAVDAPAQQSISYGDYMVSFEEETRLVVYPEQSQQPETVSDADKAWKKEAAGRVMKAGGKPKDKEAGAGTKRRRTSSVNKRKQLVDLRTLLIQCVEAVGGNDFRNANDFLMQIRNHSSPFGNASQRKAHYFAKALEARLAGTGTKEYAALASKTVLNADIEACKLLISACPFMEVSNFFATETILKLAKRSTTGIHIIHFGFPYGLQWAALIQYLSTRPGKPPALRITGIDHDHVPQTGHNFLANCCEQFNVPFEYNSITTKWERIELEDLKIDRKEVTVVNCLYRLRHVEDETDDLSSPRDTVLNLVRKINPDVFIHGIVNGSYNAPFFVSRFREALYYYSTMFDMLEEIAPGGDSSSERMVLEENIYGKEIMNVVACEGSERVERPETYKQRQVRNLRAGLKQISLNHEMLKYAKSHVKLHYHKEFLVDEDRNWMLQGWKGRILFALSFWRAAKDP